MSDHRQLVPARATSVVSLPPEIDLGNARSIEEKLSAAARSGASTVIADMSRTIFCDCAGAHRIQQAHHHAAAHHTELRLAIPSAAVRRLFAMLAVDRLVPIYPNLDTALTAVTHNGAPHRPRPPTTSAGHPAPPVSGRPRTATRSSAPAVDEPSR
jgi:anti-anti-sigma factor